MTFGVGHHQVIYGGGDQVLRTVPLNRHARPTAVTACTYKILDLRLSEDDPLRVVAEGNATLDATTTTTTAAVGLGANTNPKRIPVNSTAGFSQGRRYLLLADDGQRELVLCWAIGANYIESRDEIAKQFASGSTLRGIEVSATFPALEASNEDKFQDQGGPYGVDWSWDLDPSPRREIIFITRQPDSLLVTEEEVIALEPTLPAHTGQRLTIPTAIRVAAQEVRTHLQLHQIDPDNFHAGEALKMAVIWRAVWHVLRHLDGQRNIDRAQAAKEESQKLLDSISIGRPPEKSVKVNPSTDSAPAGTSKPYNHWQLIS